MEDTESLYCADCGSLLLAVTVGSIRWRILKDRRAAMFRGKMAPLQWARSDGGY